MPNTPRAPDSASASTAGREDAAALFRDFLTNPPWIKSLVFDWSRNRYIDRSNPKAPKRWTGFTKFEAALQPNGYYLRYLTNDMWSRTPGAVGERISGADVRYWWQLDPGHDALGLAPRHPENGQSPTNGREILCREDIEIIGTVRRLGLDPSLDCPIVWKDRDHFTSHSASHGPLSGAITSYARGMPTALQCRVGTNTIPTLFVQYKYQENLAFPPHEIVVFTARDGKTSPRFTNIIYSLDTGIDERYPAGYKPSDFRRKQAPLTTMVVWSNGFRYYIRESGAWEKINESPPVNPLSQPGPRLAANVAVWSLALIGLVTVVLATRRSVTKLPANKSIVNEETQS